MVDKDGKFTYSYIINIIIESKTGIRVRSSVVSTAFTIEFNNVPSGLYNIDLLSMNGQVMQSTRLNISADHTAEQVIIKSGTAKGMYIVRVQKSGAAIGNQEKIFIR
jgi:hypothetical protein